MIIKRTLLKACNSIRFLPRKRTTRILLMENHMRHSNDMMLSACFANMFLRSKSIPFACFIIFHWNLFLNIFRKHLYWQWLQGCCLTFFLFPFLYVTMWSESQSMRHKSFPIFFLFFRRTLLHSVQIRFEYYISIGMACAFFFISLPKRRWKMLRFLWKSHHKTSNISA